MEQSNPPALVRLSEGLGPNAQTVRGLQALRVVLGIDSPETRGWAPAVQQEARRAIDRALGAIAALPLLPLEERIENVRAWGQEWRERELKAAQEADELRAHLRLAVDYIAALNGALEDLASLGATIAICGTKYDDAAARAVLGPNAL